MLTCTTATLCCSTACRGHGPSLLCHSPKHAVPRALLSSTQAAQTAWLLTLTAAAAAVAAASRSYGSPCRGRVELTQVAECCGDIHQLNLAADLQGSHKIKRTHLHVLLPWGFAPQRGWPWCRAGRSVLELGVTTEGADADGAPVSVKDGLLVGSTAGRVILLGLKPHGGVCHRKGP